MSGYVTVIGKSTYFSQRPVGLRAVPDWAVAQWADRRLTELSYSNVRPVGWPDGRPVNRQRQATGDQVIRRASWVKECHGTMRSDTLVSITEYR